MSSEIQEILVSNSIFDQLDLTKRCTIRLGVKEINLGKTRFVNDITKEFRTFEVYKVYTSLIKQIPLCDLMRDNVLNYKELITLLGKFYEKTINENSLVTVIKFR